MDRNAFIRILQDHRHRVFSHCVYCLRDRDEAEDVVQDVFLRLWRHRDTVDPERVEAWLMRVAHNLCIDRSRRRRTVRDSLDRPELRRTAEDAAEAARARDPEQDLQRDQTRTMLLDAMADLGAETRSALLMHYFQDLRIEEIAGILDLKTSTVKVRLHRARKALRTALEPIVGHGAAMEREGA